jgi:AcrR family transcriptional regulator
MPDLPQSTKIQIVLVAERLFAQHGLEGVSLRQIGTVAGAGNNSAVQYHFGSKDKLIEAIFAYRLPGLHQRRVLLMAERRPRDLRGLVECQALTVLGQGEQPGSHYLGFIAMLRHHGRRDVFEHAAPEVHESIRAFHARFGALLAHLPESLRAQRIARAMALMVQSAADREQAHASGRGVLALAVELADLVDGVVGLLQAPASAAALSALEETPSPDVVWPPFL